MNLTEYEINFKVNTEDVLHKEELKRAVNVINECALAQGELKECLKDYYSRIPKGYESADSHYAGILTIVLSSDKTINRLADTMGRLFISGADLSEDVLSVSVYGNYPNEELLDMVAKSCPYLTGEVEIVELEDEYEEYDDEYDDYDDDEEDNDEY